MKKVVSALLVVIIALLFTGCLSNESLSAEVDALNTAVKEKKQKVADLKEQISDQKIQLEDAESYNEDMEVYIYESGSYLKSLERRVQFSSMHGMEITPFQFRQTFEKIIGLKLPCFSYDLAMQSHAYMGEDKYGVYLKYCLKSGDTYTDDLFYKLYYDNDNEHLRIIEIDCAESAFDEYKDLLNEYNFAMACTFVTIKGNLNYSYNSIYYEALDFINEQSYVDTYFWGWYLEDDYEIHFICDFDELVDEE